MNWQDVSVGDWVRAEARMASFTGIVQELRLDRHGKTVQVLVNDIWRSCVIWDLVEYKEGGF